ncbi:LAME_0H02168g1_1 [Lachancea meyersii CBS 8951]|uniref:Polynucleotide 5'-hydroxyl-kinase GRC3 n=1 Tax=Lachancea meyersii CBS 8951 TaxID=1266667 RepID=A0A1G4KDB2_9SACH|nr:LAME_0H02168g1_1 [Lachancea meyersii CBS 8951]
MASLPGLTDPLEPLNVAPDAHQQHCVALDAGAEWRVRIPQDSQLTLTIKQGIAEIFGTELALAMPYTFQGTSMAVRAVEDVALDWSATSPGDVEHRIVSEADTNASHLYNLHFALDKLRAAANAGSSSSSMSTSTDPRVLLVGERAAGKTSVAKTLCSYALKTRAQGPVAVNLDPQQCVYAPPGCVSATPISDLIDVQNNGWGHSTTSGATALHAKQPLVKNFGLERIGNNRPLYLAQVRQLAVSLDARLARDAGLRRAGVVVDTPALAELLIEDEKRDFSLVRELVALFHINAVVVCGSDDSLAVELHRELPVETLTIVRLPTSSGVVLTEDVQLRALQRNAIRDYFYGDATTVLSPYAVSVDFDAITVWEPESTVSGTLEAGREPQARLTPVEINASNLQHALVAVTYAGRRASREEVLESSILGFALILEVNDTRRKLRVLLPVPGRLPDTALILTASRYLE